MKKILIVDDAMFMREVIRGILQSGGYTELIEAEDGEAALAQYKLHKPDLVILDITMPGVSGLETLKQLRDIDNLARIVMCSAIGQDKQMLRAIQMGAVDYIVKPFKPESMLRIIKNALAA